jgi:hypothetical protein
LWLSLPRREPPVMKSLPRTRTNDVWAKPHQEVMRRLVKLTTPKAEKELMDTTTMRLVMESDPTTILVSKAGTEDISWVVTLA